MSGDEGPETTYFRVPKLLEPVVEAVNSSHSSVLRSRFNREWVRR